MKSGLGVLEALQVAPRIGGHSGVPKLINPQSRLENPAQALDQELPWCHCPLLTEETSSEGPGACRTVGPALAAALT